jgi:hypothetical protein
MGTVIGVVKRRNEQAVRTDLRGIAIQLACLRARQRRQPVMTTGKFTRDALQLRCKTVGAAPHEVCGPTPSRRRLHPPPHPTSSHNHAPTAPEPAIQSTVVTALREQLRAQKKHYETEIADLKAENTRTERALAAAHSDLHRLSHNDTPDTGQRR